MLLFPQQQLDPSTMLRHLNGKFSAYDMSQYIFWTGDEEGKALQPASNRLL